MENTDPDTEKFIKLVMMNPCLWDQNKNTNRAMKQSCWAEIAKQMFFNYEGMRESLKYENEELLKRKWQNLKKKFNKELLRIKNRDDTNWMPSPYFLQLSFLTPCDVNKEKTFNGREKNLTEEEYISVDVDVDFFTSSTSGQKINTSATCGTHLEFIPPPPTPPNEETMSNVKEENHAVKEVDVNIRSSLSGQKRKIDDDSGTDYESETDNDYEAAKLQKNNTNRKMSTNNMLDNESDRQFLLSLLPALNSMSNDKKMGVKIAIMQTIQSAM